MAGRSHISSEQISSQYCRVNTVGGTIDQFLGDTKLPASHFDGEVVHENDLTRILPTIDGPELVCAK